MRTRTSYPEKFSDYQAARCLGLLDGSTGEPPAPLSRFGTGTRATRHHRAYMIQYQRAYRPRLESDHSTLGSALGSAFMGAW